MSLDAYAATLLGFARDNPGTDDVLPSATAVVRGLFAPPGRDPARYAAARAALVGVTDWNEGVEILAARDLVPFGWVARVQPFGAFRSSALVRDLPVLASDVAGLMAAQEYLHEAVLRLRSLPQIAQSVFLLADPIVRVSVATDRIMGTLVRPGADVGNLLREYLRQQLRDVARERPALRQQIAAAVARARRAIPAKHDGVRWLYSIALEQTLLAQADYPMAPGYVEPLGATSWREVANPWVPLVHCMRRGYYPARLPTDSAPYTETAYWGKSLILWTVDWAD